ncbi:MAG: hypothetical protein HYX72_00135 [Acidobacteria bacterium]|nr:hypothetical protein [Acidobacteriota bacterium]
MATNRIASLKPSPVEGRCQCAQCKFELNLKKGQLVPPCPRCGGREFEEASGPACN